MSRHWRNPALWVGITLIVLGAGNWINGQIKLDEYEALASRAAPEFHRESVQGYRHLDSELGARVSQTLRPANGWRTLAQEKREFYRVVVTGGRLLILAGVFFLVLSLRSFPHPSNAIQRKEN